MGVDCAAYADHAPDLAAAAAAGPLGQVGGHVGLGITLEARDAPAPFGAALKAVAIAPSRVLVAIVGPGDRPQVAARGVGDEVVARPGDPADTRASTATGIADGDASAAADACARLGGGHAVVARRLAGCVQTARRDGTARGRPVDLADCGFTSLIEDRGGELDRLVRSQIDVGRIKLQ